MPSSMTTGFGGTIKCSLSSPSGSESRSSYPVRFWSSTHTASYCTRASETSAWSAAIRSAEPPRWMSHRMITRTSSAA